MSHQQSILQSPTASSPYIQRARPLDYGIDASILDRVDQIIRKQYPKMRSFLLVHDGQLLYERYYGGHTVQSLNDLRSATKSFTSMLLGIAVSRGEVPSVDASVYDVFRQLIPAQTHPALKKLSLRHLLTMTSGFAWQTGKKLGEPLIHRFHRNRQWVRYALSLPIVQQDIGTFQYRSTDSHLLSAAISKGTGMDAYAYARLHLFEPLGIQHTAWSPIPRDIVWAMSASISLLEIWLNSDIAA